LVSTAAGVTEREPISCSAPSLPSVRTRNTLATKREQMLRCTPF
jgi:hypothetical protein